MNRLPMSRTASALLRALICRAQVPSDRILLTDVQSVDWQSLTFVGERHRFELRVIGSRSLEVADRLCRDLGNAEFSIHRQIVADISTIGDPLGNSDGSASITIEALTISE